MSALRPLVGRVIMTRAGGGMQALTAWKRGTDMSLKTEKTQLTTNCYLEHD